MRWHRSVCAASAQWLGIRSLIGIAGCVALLMGLASIPETLAMDLGGAAEGVGQMAAVTIPAALLIAAAAAVNLLAGAILARRLRGRPFESRSDLVLWGFVGAVGMDLVLLYTLGALDMFRAPVLMVVHAAVIGLGWWSGEPLLAIGRGGSWPRPSWFGLLVALAWAPPILLQLASPVPPFMDVLPNHVAPVEHLRVFGSFDPLTTTPSPVYGPSRTSLGFVAVLGALATMTGLSAALAVSALIAVEVVLVGVAAHRLALASSGRQAATWMLFTFVLTQSFARLADDRARILVLPVAAMALVEYAALARRRDGALAVAPWGRLAPAAAALGATILFHAVIGAFVAATLLVLPVLDRRHHLGDALVVVGVGGIAAVPQAAIMVGLDLPAATGLVALPAALGAAAILRFRIVRLVAAALVVGAACRALLAVLIPLDLPAASRDWADGFFHTVPLLTGTTLVGLVALRARLPSVVWAGIFVGAAAGSLAHALPSDSGSLLVDALRFEIPKEVHSWLPIFLALAAAVALARFGALMRSRSAGSLARVAATGAMAAFVILAILPVRFEPIDPLYTGEHRVAENMAIHLRYAERGFFVGYPDSRWVVNAEQSRILAKIRARIAAGLIGPDSRLLHVAQTSRHFESTPVAAMTGMRVTMVSEDGRVTIHNVGGDLRTPDQLDSLLASRDPAFPYLLLEPDVADWQAVRVQIVEAGYRSILATSEGELFERLPED